MLPFFGFKEIDAFLPSIVTDIHQLSFLSENVPRETKKILSTSITLNKLPNNMTHVFLGYA